MIVFFAEEDLVSFGNYMVSDLRREMYENHPDLKDENIEGRLKSVSDADLANWAYFSNQKTQESINEG